MVRGKSVPANLSLELPQSSCVTLSKARHLSGLVLPILGEEMEMNGLKGLSWLKKAGNLRTWDKNSGGIFWGGGQI